MATDSWLRIAIEFADRGDQRRRIQVAVSWLRIPHSWLRIVSELEFAERQNVTTDDRRSKKNNRKGANLDLPKTCACRVTAACTI